MVSRITLPEGRPLQFKDDVYVRDRITTGDRSLVRVLLGGKAIVTARERSVLTITEIPGVSTVHLEEGRISVAVSKGLMKASEVIEIKTPNAVSAIRGTVVVAEVLPGATVRSTISVLRGLVEVTRLDTGRQVGKSVFVGASQAITVAGSRALTQPNAITAGDVKRLTAFRMVPRDLARGATTPAVEFAKQHAIDDATHAVSAHTAAAKAVGIEARGKKQEGAVDHNGGDDKGKDKGNKNDTDNGADLSSSVTAPIGSSPQGGTALTPTAGGLSASSSPSVSDAVLGGALKKSVKK
jgi:FecR protein